MMSKSQKTSVSLTPFITVDPAATGVKCNGGSAVLGHPEVYFAFDNKDSIVCSYCGCQFVKAR